MRSTGEVMGIDADLGIAYGKAQMSAQPALPARGNVFISVKDSDKRSVVAYREGIRQSWIHPLRHRWHGEGPEGRRDSGQATLQAARGPPKYLGSHQER